MTKMTGIKEVSKRWGIVIGVDTYANAGEHLRNLQGCVADANRMFQTMTDKNCCGFAEDNVVMLANPTYADIESAFEKVGAKMKRGDEFWFYYAGHGYSERRRNGVSGYLLPSDVKLNENGKLSTRSCISHSGLRDDFIARFLPEHGNITVVMFLDCCCAASVGLADGSRGASADVQEMSDGFTKSFRDLGFLGNPEDGDRDAEGDDWDFKYISFMATGKTDKAREDASGGVFTKYLIEGLKGGRPPKCSTTGVDDYFVRAGALGGFLGNYLPNQPPAQSVPDSTYPLSISREKKAKLEQEEKMDKEARAWLLKMGEKHLRKEIQRFAENVVDKSESGDFKHADLLRNLIHHFSVPSVSPIGLDVVAELIKAFYEMKKLLEGKNAPDTKVPQQKDPPRPSSVRPVCAPSGADRLSMRDRELLADVAYRLGSDDLESVTTQQEAVVALNEAARKWVRNACLRNYQPLYTSNERAKWSNQEGKGFDSLVESAVRELVLDDAALAARKR